MQQRNNNDDNDDKRFRSCLCATDVVQAHKDAQAGLAEQLVDLQEAAGSLSSSMVLDHAIAHVQFHQFVMEQHQQQKGGNKKTDRRATVNHQTAAAMAK